MKRGIFLLMSVCLLALAGCGSISESDYHAVLAERDELLIQMENLEKEYETVCEERDALLASTSESPELIDATIRGHFVAQVRSTMPDYVSDTVPTMALVTCFQSSPFTLYLGEELISQVEVGKTYIFNIKEKNIELTQQQYNEYPPSPEIAVPLYGLEITSILPAGEEDYGLDSYQFEYE